MLICPCCDGEGELHAHIVVRCPVCLGTGSVDDGFSLRALRGDSHRRQRMASAESLAECASRLQISPAALSAYELGRKLPDALLQRIEPQH